MNILEMTDIKNPWVRRPLLISFVLCAIPFLILICVAEFAWKSIKAMIDVIKTQIQESLPDIKQLIADIRDIW